MFKVSYKLYRIWDHLQMGIVRLRLLFFLLSYPSCSMWDLSSLTRAQTMLPALGAQNLSHWTTREALRLRFWGVEIWKRCFIIDIHSFIIIFFFLRTDSWAAGTNLEVKHSWFLSPLLPIQTSHICSISNIKLNLNTLIQHMWALSYVLNQCKQGP